MGNNVAGRKAADTGSAPALRGRPRQWTDGRERRAAYRACRREWVAQLEALYVALVNAAWDDPAVQQAVNCAEDEEVVRVLREYYQHRKRRP